MNVLRANPGLLVMVALVGVATLVVGLIAFMMARSGQSLRPVIWFAGFFGIIVVPQFAYHLGVAMGWLQEIPAWTSRSGPGAKPGKTSSTNLDLDRTAEAR